MHITSQRLHFAWVALQHRVHIACFINTCADVCLSCRRPGTYSIVTKVKPYFHSTTYPKTSSLVDFYGNIYDSWPDDGKWMPDYSGPSSCRVQIVPGQADCDCVSVPGECNCRIEPARNASSSDHNFVAKCIRDKVCESKDGLDFQFHVFVNDRYGNKRVPIANDPRQPANNVHVEFSGPMDIPTCEKQRPIASCQNPSFLPNRFLPNWDSFTAPTSSKSVGMWKAAGYYQVGFEVKGQGQAMSVFVTVCDASIKSDKDVSKCQVLIKFRYDTLSTDAKNVSELVFPTTPKPKPIVTAGEQQNIDVQWVDDYHQLTGYEYATGKVAALNIFSPSVFNVYVRGVEGNGGMAVEPYKDINNTLQKLETKDHAPIWPVRYGATGVVCDVWYVGSQLHLDSHSCEPTGVSCGTADGDLACVTMNYTVTLSGSYQIQLLFNNELIMGNIQTATRATSNGTRTWDMQVQPAGLDVRNTGPIDPYQTDTKFRAPFNDSEAGRHNKFVVFLRDSYGNIRDFDKHTNDSVSVAAQLDNNRGQSITFSATWSPLSPYCRSQLDDIGSTMNVGPCETGHCVASCFIISANGGDATTSLMTLSGVFMVSIYASDSGTRQPLSGTPFRLAVHPAALDVKKTLNRTFPESHAGTINVFTFVARDRYENVRVNNDTIMATMTPHRSTSDVIQQDVGWNSTYGNYTVTFRTYYSMPAAYQIGVQLKMRRSSLDYDTCPSESRFKLLYRMSKDDACAAQPVPSSPFSVFVRPARLNVTSSSSKGAPADCPGVTESGPGFNATEAGRRSSFFVVARDVYNNIRAKKRYDLSDHLDVTLTGPQFSVDEPYPCDVIDKDGNLATAIDNVRSWCNDDPSFSVHFTVDVSGHYTMTALLEDKEHLHEPDTVLPAPMTWSGAIIFVHPAALDVSKTLNRTFPESHAGTINVFTFVARDRYENVRVNNDTIMATMTPHRSTSDVIQQDVGWNSTYGNYTVTFRTYYSMPAAYQIDVSIGMNKSELLKPELKFKGVYPDLKSRDAAAASKPLSLSPFSIFVRPAGLDVEKSAAHGAPTACPESGPGFKDTEAGRLTSFSVVPRDKFDNIRAKAQYQLSDQLKVTAGKMVSPAGELSGNTSCDVSDVPGKLGNSIGTVQQYWCPESMLEHGPSKHVSFTLTEDGDYKLWALLGDPEHRNEPSSAAVPWTPMRWGEQTGCTVGGGCVIHVHAAALEVHNTHLKHVFHESRAGATNVFKLVARDRYNNTRGHNDTFKATISAGGDRLTPTVSWDGKDTEYYTMDDCWNIEFSAKKLVEYGHFYHPYTVSISVQMDPDKNPPYNGKFIQLPDGCCQPDGNCLTPNKPPELVPGLGAGGSPFRIVIHPAALDLKQYSTHLWSTETCARPNYSCEKFYTPPARFEPDWAECQKHGCLMQADNAKNELQFTLRDRFKNVRNGHFFGDKITLNVGGTDPNDPETFSCTALANASYHSCVFHVSKAQRYNLTASVAYLVSADCTSVETVHDPCYEPGNPANLSDLSRNATQNQGKLPDMRSDGNENRWNRDGTWDVDIGPGEVDAGTSRMEINPTSTEPSATVCFGGQTGRASAPIYGSSFDPADAVRLTIKPHDRSGNPRYGLDNLIVMLTPVGIREKPTTVGPGFNPDYDKKLFSQYGDSLVFKTNRTDLDNVIGVAKDPQQPKRYFGTGISQTIQWGKLEKQGGACRSNCWGAATYTVLVQFPAAGVWQIDAWLCPVQLRNFSACTAQTQHAVIPGKSFNDSNNTAMQLLVCQQNTAHSVQTAVAPGLSPRGQEYRSKVESYAERDFNAFVDKVHIRPAGARRPFDQVPAKRREELLQVMNRSCLCKPGWIHFGDKTKDSTKNFGDLCHPCEVGTHQDLYGQRVCMACAAGNKSECPEGEQNTVKACPGHNPANTECTKCDAGRYQFLIGQEKCLPCPKGFDCGDGGPATEQNGIGRAGKLRNQKGMVYPVALPGSWVALTDPTEIRECKPKAACPGGSWEGMDGSSNRNGGREDVFSDVNHPWLQKVSDCFLRPWVLMPQKGYAQYCAATDPPGKDYTSHNFSIGRNPENHTCTNVQEVVSDLKHALDAKRNMPGCDVIIGSKCAPGYTGTGCASCCTNCHPDPEAASCFKNNQDDPICVNKTSVECTRLGNCGIVTGNYYKPTTGADKDKCVPCKSNSWKIGLMFAAGILLGGPVLAKVGGALKHAGEMTAPLTTIVTFFQTLGLFENLHIEWPEEITDFFKQISGYMSLLNFNIDAFHTECSLPMTFEQKWLLQVLSPVAFCVVALFVGLLLFGASKLGLAKRFEWRHMLDRLVWVMLLYMTVGYVTLVQLCLKISQCKRNLDNVYYLVSNPDLACQGRTPSDWKALFGHEKGTALFGHEKDFQMFGSYQSIKTFANMLGVLYGAGIPMLFLWIMIKNRKHLKRKEYLRKYGILTNKMSEDRFYWEVCVTMRKCLITVVTMMWAPAKSSTVKDHVTTSKNVAAALLSLAIIMLFLVAHTWAQPYVDVDVNKAELVSLMTQYIVLLMGLGFQTKAAFENDPGGVISNILNGLQGLVIACVVVNVAFSASVVMKKAGGLVDSIGQEEMSLDDDIADILHKGVVPIANAWVAQSDDADHERVRHLIAKIRAFKQTSKLEYNATFARCFKEEEVYTVYGWRAIATPEEQQDLNWFVRALTEKRFERQFKLLRWIDCCGCRERCKKYYRVDLMLNEDHQQLYAEQRDNINRDPWAELQELQALKAEQQVNPMSGSRNSSSAARSGPVNFFEENKKFRASGRAGLDGLAERVANRADSADCGGSPVMGLGSFKPKRNFSVSSLNILSRPGGGGGGGSRKKASLAEVELAEISSMTIGESSGGSEMQGGGAVELGDSHSHLAISTSKRAKEGGGSGEKLKAKLRKSSQAAKDGEALQAGLREVGNMSIGGIGEDGPGLSAGIGTSHSHLMGASSKRSKAKKPPKASDGGGGGSSDSIYSMSSPAVPVLPVNDGAAAKAAKPPKEKKAKKEKKKKKKGDDGDLRTTWTIGS
eukprot:SAG22_NODE_148_length_17459_cov_18.266359_5_plen_3015_part_00